MRIVRIGLLALLAVLQYQLWVGGGSVPFVWRLQQEVQAQRLENVRLAERNESLIAEVVDLKQGLEALEERARAELGMVKPGETFFRVVEGSP